jgi:hypothetical protein
MQTKDYLEIGYWVVSVGILVATVYYIAHGPVNAVKIGRQLNNEQQQDNAKQNLFLTLFAYRGSPIHRNFVDGLNQIDIVFHDTPSVLISWHNHFRQLQQRDLTDPERIWEIGRVELLSQMALALGYGAIQQTEIMQHYYPEGHSNIHLSDLEIRDRLAVWLKSANVVNQILIDQNTGDSPQEENQEKN